MKKFEVCIDMGDVISVQKKVLINESGAYCQDPDGLKSYMFDFFLQVDLASVNSDQALGGQGSSEENKSDVLDV